MTSVDTGPSPELLARAARIRLACFDVDGTLTDGRLYFSDDGHETKAFHVQDGQGLALLCKSGIDVVFVTARTSAAAKARARDLGVQCLDGVKDKRAAVEALCVQAGITVADVAFMGDDLADLGVLRVAGLAVAPANAHRWIRDAVHWTTGASGGGGAARELCDLVLTAQGKVEALLAEAAP